MDKINFQNLPSTATPINATNMNLLQNNVENAINGIIETGSNANGSYIKFFDGTLICMNVVEDTYAMTVPWGSLYETANNATTGSTTFPIEFLSKPYLSVAHINNSYGGMIGDIMYDKTGISRVNWRRPTSNTNQLVYSYIAIGKWK